MNHRQAFALALLLATIATATGRGSVRVTAHGALRISLGSWRLHADTEEVTVWRAGGPSILWTVDAPVSVALPPVPVAPEATARLRYRVPAWRRPASVGLVGLTC